MATLSAAEQRRIIDPLGTPQPIWPPAVPGRMSMPTRSYLSLSTSRSMA